MKRFLETTFNPYPASIVCLEKHCLITSNAYIKMYSFIIKSNIMNQSPEVIKLFHAQLN